MDNDENIKLDLIFVEEGRRLLQILDDAGIMPSAMVWFYFKEPKMWRLLIASPSFDKISAQERYRKTLNIFAKEKFIRLEFENLVLLAANDPLISLLGVAVSTPPKSVSDIRFISSTINGFYVDDALIYRLSQGNIELPRKKK